MYYFYSNSFIIYFIVTLMGTTLVVDTLNPILLLLAFNSTVHGNVILSSGFGGIAYVRAYADVSIFVEGMKDSTTLTN